MKTLGRIIFSVILIVLFDSSSSSFWKKYWTSAPILSQVETTEFHQSKDMVLGFSEHNPNLQISVGEKDFKTITLFFVTLHHLVQYKIVENKFTLYTNDFVHHIVRFTTSDIIFPFHYFW